MYSEKLLDHFHHPRNAGEIELPTAVVEKTNPVCGDALKLSVKVRNGVVTEARFKAQGCVPAVACGSWLAGTIAGKHVSQLRTLTPQEIENGLGGLPPASRHAATLAIEVLQQVLAQLEP